MARTRVAPQRQTGVTDEGFQFAKITGQTGEERFLLRAADAKSVDFDQKTSIRLLTEAGLVAVDQDLEIPVLFADRKLQRTLTNNGEYTWFYTLGKGPLNLPEFQHVENGILVPGRGEIEATVRNWEGPHPLSLIVHSADYARDLGWRFDRDANGRPSDAAPVVYGKLAGDQAQAGREAAAQKVSRALVSSFAGVVSKLDAATQAGVLEPHLVNIAKEVLRAIE